MPFNDAIPPHMVEKFAEWLEGEDAKKKGEELLHEDAGPHIRDILNEEEE